MNEKRYEVGGADPSMPTWRAKRNQEAIVDPFLDRAGVHLEKLPHLTRRQKLVADDFHGFLSLVRLVDFVKVQNDKFV